MKITLVIYSLSAGGAEKVASALASHWAQAGHQVTLATLDTGERDFFRMDRTVRRIALGLANDSGSWPEFVRNNLRRVKCLRSAMLDEGPQAIVSFLDSVNVLVLLAMLGSRIPVIVSERIDPRKKPTGAAVRLLRRVAYPRARALVVQTRQVESWARRIVNKENIFVIPNGISGYATAHDGRPRIAGGPLTVLSIGRLDRQKGFDLLVQAFAQCADIHPEWLLRIIGEGPERERLSSLIRQMGVSDRVRLDHLVDNPAAALIDSALFVLPSRYEGFPNVLLEAMAAGLPVISADCPSGPAEIVRNGIDGVLVPAENVNALAAAMNRLMASAEDRKRLGARAIEVRQRFDQISVMEMWDHVLERAVA